MAATPFARARKFLDYNAAAKWGALAAAAGTGILYIAYLLLLALFADLLVNQGAIPTLNHLPKHEQERFAEEVLATNGAADRHSGEWEKRLTAMGFGVDGAVGNLARIAAADVGGDPTPRQAELRRELRWRWYVFEYLRGAVGEHAADYVREQTATLVKDIGPELAADRDIPDSGVLSFVIRTRSRPDGILTAWVAGVNTWMWQDRARWYLPGLFVTALVLAVVRAVLMFVNKYMAARATTEAATRLRRAIYHHTYRLGTLAFRALGPTEAVSVSTRHLEAVHDGMYTWLTAYFREPIKFFLLLAFALIVNVWLTLAFVIFALLVWMIGGQIAAYFREKGRQASERSAEQLALMQESLMLMRLVKVYLMELFNQTRVERHLVRSAAAQLSRYRGEAIYRPLLVLMGVVAALVLLYFVGLVVINRQLSIAGATVLTTALVSMYLPVQKWLDCRRFVRRGRESASVLFEFLDRKGEVGQVVEAEFLTPLAEKLEFANVSLKEPGTGRNLLRGVNLTIEAGQRVAIVGPDDMEKHALVYLIPRFLDPNSGEIRIDGRNLRWVTLDSLRAQIAIVLQHNLVFNDTVANNIGCGDKSFRLPQIIEVAKMAHAHQFIQKLPKGYETPIGELGAALNIGEQFRIALARAILRDPALLIIEEPVVPLDEETKDLIDDSLARVLPGRTVIFLPHRLSTIRHCDRVFLLFNGQIAASGEHKELLNRNELYRHLQYLEFNEFAGVIGGKPVAGGLL